MPDAGWYPDPADASKERWWGGVEWTHDVRSLVVAAPVFTPQQPLINVPGGGINPFADIDVQAAQQSVHGFEPVMQAPQPDFGVPRSFELARQMELYRRPSNGVATSGLVFSLLPVPIFSLIGLILSIAGLVKSSGFKSDGLPPVGRKRSVWGIVFAFVIPSALTAFALPIVLDQQQQQERRWAAHQSELVEGAPEVDQSIVILELDGSPAVWSRGLFELGFSASFAEGAGSPPTWVRCPDEAEMLVGTIVACQFEFAGIVHDYTYEFTDIHGGGIITLDGQVVEQ